MDQPVSRVNYAVLSVNQKSILFGK